MTGTTTTPSGVNIPSDCSSDQLFQDANEVVTLSTNLAHLEDQFDRMFFKYYSDAPSGYSDKGREAWALNQIKENHSELWTEIDTNRARMKGLVLKASIVKSAVHVAGIESGTGIYGYSGSPSGVSNV